MGLLDRKKLLQKELLKTQKVDLGENDFVYVRQMTGRERDQFERSLLKEVKDSKGKLDYERSIEDFRAKLAVNTVCDENGNLLLQPNDFPLLSQSMSAFRLEKIVNIAQEINKITEDDKEGLIKNSDADLKDGSSSDSAKN